MPTQLKLVSLAGFPAQAHFVTQDGMSLKVQVSESDADRLAHLVGVPIFVEFVDGRANIVIGRVSA